MYSPHPDPLPEGDGAQIALPLRETLLGWYGEHGRSLPWRRSRDPYRVWVAEVMLQQTRIGVVIPAYRRFLRAFPSLARLAAAQEEEVLSLWSGLGYYSRARALHRAARALHARGECFPRSWTEARRLPGVGAYTAAAVLSIAYGLPYAAVDGNVVRVLSRLFRLPLPDGRGEPYHSLAEKLLDRRRPGDWNQALMELGETVCSPKMPACEHCPLAAYCEAASHGQAHLYPRRRRRRAPERVDLRMTIVRDREGRLLLERGAFPHLKHLWLPPTEIVTDAPRPSDGPCRARFRHAIVHRDFHVRVHRRTMTQLQLRRLLARADGVGRRLFTAAELDRIGRSSLLTKGLRYEPAESEKREAIEGSAPSLPPRPSPPGTDRAVPSRSRRSRIGPSNDTPIVNDSMTRSSIPR